MLQDIDHRNGLELNGKGTFLKRAVMHHTLKGFAQLFSLWAGFNESQLPAQIHYILEQV